MLIGFVLLQACTTTRHIPLDEYQSKSKQQKYGISGLETVDGKVYKFDLIDASYAKLQGQIIKGQLHDGTNVEVPLKQVKTLYVEELSTGKTIIFAGTVLLVILILVALNEAGKGLAAAFQSMGA